MNMHKQSRRMTICLGINWAGFAICIGWISKVQGNISWWRELNWQSWLNDLATVAQLGMVPAGSIPILWLLLSCVFTALWLPTRSAKHVIPEQVASPAKNRLTENAAMMETHPELKEKILRLHQSLENI
jgi:hypothetical protein